MKVKTFRKQWDCKTMSWSMSLFLISDSVVCVPSTSHRKLCRHTSKSWWNMNVHKQCQLVDGFFLFCSLVYWMFDITRVLGRQHCGGYDRAAEFQRRHLVSVSPVWADDCQSFSSTATCMFALYHVLKSRNLTLSVYYKSTIWTSYTKLYTFWFVVLSEGDEPSRNVSRGSTT